MWYAFSSNDRWELTPLIGLKEDDMDIYTDTMTTTYNTAMTDTVTEILGKDCQRKEPWITKDLLYLCDDRKELKKRWYEAEGAKAYWEANKRIQKVVKKAKENWIGMQCKEIEACLNKSNIKRTYQLVKDLISKKQG